MQKVSGTGRHGCVLCVRLLSMHTHMHEDAYIYIYYTHRCICLHAHKLDTTQMLWF